MKSALAIAALSLMSSLASAGYSAQILSAKLDDAKKNLIVEISYGGCSTYPTKLKINGCFESYPVQCPAQVIVQNDGPVCRMLLTETVSFSLAEQGLNNSYFAGGLLMLEGDFNSKAYVELP